MAHALLTETTAILGDLIAFPSVSQDSNVALIDYLKRRLELVGAHVEVTHDADGGKDIGLATIGPSDMDGGVVLSGDLYHYPAERTLDRLPTFEVSQAETQAARQELEAFLTRADAQLWIQHDLAAHRKLKKAPEYYD